MEAFMVIPPIDQTWHFITFMEFGRRRNCLSRPCSFILSRSFVAHLHNCIWQFNITNTVWI